MIHIYPVAVMTIRRPVAERSAEGVALIAGGGASGIIFVILVVAVEPVGADRCLAAVGAEMAFKTFLIQVMAVRAILQVGEPMKLFALNTQPRLFKNMVDPCTMTVVADFRAGAESAFDAMALIADADVGFQCRMFRLAVHPAGPFGFFAARGIKMTGETSWNITIPLKVTAVTDGACGRALAVYSRPVKRVGCQQAGIVP